MKIEYPKKTSEFEIQATLWNELIKQGIDARLEVKQERCRLDIVLFLDEQARGIIECKSWSKKYVRNRKYQTYKNTKQYQKYTDLFKLPLFVCGCKASILPAIHFAKACCGFVT